jgi:hypothetical protein
MLVAGSKKVAPVVPLEGSPDLRVRGHRSALALQAKVDPETALVRDARHPRHPLVDATSTVGPQGVVTETPAQRVDLVGEVIEAAGDLGMLARPPLMRLTLRPQVREALVELSGPPCRSWRSPRR